MRQTRRTSLLITVLAGVVLALAQMDAIADDILWKSGKNLYIKLADQDAMSDGRRIANGHPVTLDAREITNALSLLEIWNKKGFFKGLFKREGDEVRTLYSVSQARLLGLYIAQGLRKARPDQDIVFALARAEKKFRVLQERTFTAGRAFYHDGQLNVIIGDYDRLPDKFKERAYKSSGVSEIHYYFKLGKRARPSGFKHRVLVRDGVHVYTENGKQRPDWLVIDVKRASQTYLAERNQDNGPAHNASNAAIQQEAARLAKERRELRLEMARMRKEMRQLSTDEPAGAVARSLEERMAVLNELYEKNLISRDEYESKRQELLGEI